VTYDRPSGREPMRRNHTLIAALGLLTLTLAGCPNIDTLPGNPVESCLLSECHEAVENAHYGSTPALLCVDCHGGDNTSPVKEESHVTVDVSFNPTTPGSRFLDVPSMKELDELDPAIIQFINPSDYRVAPQVCGTNALGGVQCHPNITRNSLMLNRATMSGQMNGGGFLAGIWGQAYRYGVVPTTDDYLPSQIPEGFTDELHAFPTEAPDDVLNPIAESFFPIYEQMCIECHLGRDGPRIPGRYYSSGCAGCHMLSDDDARAKTPDITQDVEELGHVATHRLTNLIPDSQCAHCHISHLGRALLAQGVRERSEERGDTPMGGNNPGLPDPENAVPWAEENYVRYQGLYEIYGKPYPFFIEDEDGTNDIDETPPDIHTEKGLGCIDCHNIREAHGDDQLALRMDKEIDVRCETCHGRPGERGSLRSDAGLAFNIAETSVLGTGKNTPVFSMDEDGETLLQRGRFTQTGHIVTQITRNSDEADTLYNPRTRMGCELHAGSAERRLEVKEAVNALTDANPEEVPEAFPGLTEGFTFEVPDAEIDGRLECFACHNAWTVNCYGCHIVRDDREEYVSLVDGETKRGKAHSHEMTVVADQLALGMNTRGRISPMLATSIFFTHFDQAGGKVVDAQALIDGLGNSGDGNVHNPVHHHTIRKLPRDCDGCHPSATESHEDADLLTLVGFGSGRYTFVDGDGATHQLDRTVLVDYDGDGAWDDPQTAELPLAVWAIEGIISSTHVTILDDPDAPDPGPLDLEAVNLVLGSVVVPQRPDEVP
jgi:hypothetical protein